jgi:hypothetical protein
MDANPDHSDRPQSQVSESIRQVKFLPWTMDEQISNQLNDFKTDEKELEEVLSKYDLDEALEAEFNAIESHFQQLLIAYQTLLNTRRFLNNG